MHVLLDCFLAWILSLCVEHWTKQISPLQDNKVDLNLMLKTEVNNANLTSKSFLSPLSELAFTVPQRTQTNEPERTPLPGVTVVMEVRIADRRSSIGRLATDTANYKPGLAEGWHWRGTSNSGGLVRLVSKSDIIWVSSCCCLDPSVSEVAIIAHYISLITHLGLLKMCAVTINRIDTRFEPCVPN